MKQSNEKIEREISDTMKLLDEMKPLEVHHLFRVRLMQRVEREFGESSKQASGFGRRIDLKFAFMVVLVIINLGSGVVSVLNNEKPSITGISELIDNLGDDYTSQEFAYYDQTTP